MSWSINLIGKPKAIVAALEAQSGKLTGASKEEYDEVLPGLLAVVKANDSQSPPILTFNASGSASTSTGADGVKTKTHASCTVECKPTWGTFVEEPKETVASTLEIKV